MVIADGITGHWYDVRGIFVGLAMIVEVLEVIVGIV
jgi:hypothetical protein